jgi:hypothetical protein
MIDFANSKIVRRAMENVALATTGLEEGVALLGLMEDGEYVVKLSDGTTNLSFAGFAQSERQTPTLLPVCRQYKALNLTGGGVGFVLPRANVGGVVVRYTDGNGTKLTLGSSTPSAGEYYISGTTVTVNVADLNKLIQMTWMFSPTQADILAGVGGDNTPTTVGTLVGQYRTTNVIKEADDLRISNFDPAIDWDAWVPATGLKVAANGIVTTAAGTGVAITGARVVHAPDTDSEYLGIAFRV